MKPISVTQFTLTTCLGQGLAAHRDALLAGRSGLTPCVFEDVALDTWIGKVAGLDAPSGAGADGARNNRLAELALVQDGF